MVKSFDVLRKSFKYIVLVFVIVFFNYLFSGNFLYDFSEKFMTNYLSMMTNAHDLLLQKELPMWSWNFFLGGNFLGAQSIYSIFNPFFLVTLLFSSSTLPYLYFPLLLAKLLLAGWGLSLYMKETKWFSTSAIVLSTIVYLFNGWLLTNLNEFITIELLAFIPLVLYGVEKLLNSGRKRYLVLNFFVLMLSHFAFTLMFLPFFVGYIAIRLYSTSTSREFSLKKSLKQIGVTSLIIVGLSMMFILPIICAFNEITLKLQTTFNFSSLLTISFQGVFPPFHESFLGKPSFMQNSSSQLSLYQSILVLLLVPQFVKMVSNRVKRITLIGYAVTFLFVFLLPSLGFINLATLTTIDTSILSVILILFNTLMIGYVMSRVATIDLKLLKKTCYAYGGLLLLMISFMYVYELMATYGSLTDLNLKLLLKQFIASSPYFMSFMIMLLFTWAYYFIFTEHSFEKIELREKSIFTLLMIECILVSFAYFATGSDGLSNTVKSIVNEDYIGNETYAVADYLQTIDEEFYRIINSYETQYNESIYRGYNGFSAANANISSRADLSWLLTTEIEDGAYISSDDYMLTTALSAKYYFTPDYHTTLPGYVYYDRIEGITIYKNEYFIPVGSNQKYYVLDTQFEEMTDIQKQYIFLNCLILTQAQLEDISKRIVLEPYDLATLPEQPSDVHYFQAANYRQTMAVKNVEYHSNSIDAEMMALGPMFLTFSIPYDSGWEVLGNGEPLKTHRINNGFLGVEIPDSGTYELNLTYTAKGYEIGFSISAITALSIIACFYKYYEDKKKLSKNHL